MLAAELRRKYIEFFVSKGHLHAPGAPVVPIDALGELDTSTLFTSAGMQQFKPYFTGAAKPPHTRICTVQKCVRTGDIDVVGDYSHCTFFEMLGNFSFGDYFKREVITWTWEFLRDWVKLDMDRLCATVFEEDDEAYNIWRDEVGLPEDRIHRLGEDKNYWPANAISQGPNGPCGPCSEIYYRTAPLETMCSDMSLSPTERFKIDDDAGRWLEIWNNVFTQFDRSEDENGSAVLTPLPSKNNDTGAGLDRIVTVLQGRSSVFDTDLFEPVLRRIQHLSGMPYNGTMDLKDFAFRVVAEHTRSSVFCIADGILPSNEGRGYVLRRLMRRAIRFGRSQLGFAKPFLHEVAPAVIEQMSDFYPELEERREHILTTLHAEEERFRRTLDNGIGRLTEILSSQAVVHARRLSGADAFTLYDTFGFPLELTREIASEKGIAVDEEGFERAMRSQQERSREAGGDKEVFAQGGSIAELLKSVPPTVFTGYHATHGEAKVLAILQNGASLQSATAGSESVQVVLDTTPFYAESGGQVGDTGTLRFSESHVRFQVRVTDTRKVGPHWIHTVHIDDDVLRVGQTVWAQVDEDRRRDIMRNHTTTHLLQAALRKVLGSHVHQKGSLVAPDRLRFDFTHTQPVSADELKHIEALVNEHILRDEPVTVHTDIPIEEARRRGAMALFGEKYGDRVRMVEVPGFSLELCGGTHLVRTSQAGLFKIVSETGVAAGVRRIEAVTGRAAAQRVSELEQAVELAAAQMKTNPGNLVPAVEKLLAQRAQLEKEIRRLKESGTPRAPVEVEEIGEVKLALLNLGETDAETLTISLDRETSRLGAAAVVAAVGRSGDRALLAVKAGQDAVKSGVHAGNIVREAAKTVGGGGGGRPDFAQAGGKDTAKLEEALSAARELVLQAVRVKA
jgi:alanyl-tRNA synthetase